MFPLWSLCALEQGLILTKRSSGINILYSFLGSGLSRIAHNRSQGIVCTCTWLRDHMYLTVVTLEPRPWEVEDVRLKHRYYVMLFRDLLAHNVHVLVSAKGFVTKSLWAKLMLSRLILSSFASLFIFIDTFLVLIIYTKYDPIPNTSKSLSKAGLTTNPGYSRTPSRKGTTKSLSCEFNY